MSDPVLTKVPVSADPRLLLAMPINERQAKAARSRFKTDKQGNPYVLRFTLLNRFLHALLLIAITILAFTGLAQILHGNFLGSIMLQMLGGLDATQGIHHTVSILLGIVVVFHLLDILESTVIRRQTPAMLPKGKDLADAMRVLKVNLGFSIETPRYDRFNFEQKTVYFVVSLGVLLQGLTGLMQWFPIQVTEIMPGILVTYAGILHRWNAILIILVVFIWHLYQVHVRGHNLSIFSGKMSVAEMSMEHPLELEYLQKAAALVGSPTWPVKIEMNLNSEIEKLEQAAVAGTTQGSSSPKGN